MGKQILSEEFKRMQKLAGIQLNESVQHLLSFVKQNQDEIANQIGAIRLEDIRIDDLEDVGATGIYEDNGEELEGGLAFRFPEDIDDDFVGENGSKPTDINIYGTKLIYVGYNI